MILSSEPETTKPDDNPWRGTPSVGSGTNVMCVKKRCVLKRAMQSSVEMIHTSSLVPCSVVGTLVVIHGGVEERQRTEKCAYSSQLFFGKGK